MHVYITQLYLRLLFYFVLVSPIPGGGPDCHSPRYIDDFGPTPNRIRVAIYFNFDFGLQCSWDGCWGQPRAVREACWVETCVQIFTVVGAMYLSSLAARCLRPSRPDWAGRLRRIQPQSTGSATLAGLAVEDG